MKLLRDTWLLFSWSTNRTLRSSIWAIIGLFQLRCYLFLFGPLLQPLSRVPGFPPGATVFTPGVMVMMGVFGIVFSGFGLLTKLPSGCIERLRITLVKYPIAKSEGLLQRLLPVGCFPAVKC